MAKNELTINVTVNGVEDIEKLTREFEKLKELVGADKINVESSEPTYRLVSGRDARVGDFVKFSEDDLDITAGKYYEIIRISRDGDVVFVDDDNDTRFRDPERSYLGIYEKVTEAPAESSEPEPLKVGDYAKVIQAKHRQEGTIVKLEKYDPGYETDYEFISIKLDGTEGDIFKSEHLVKATEEEVAEAKAKFELQQAEAKETERWAKIGREVNEYKEGDIVKYVNDGEIYEVVGIGDHGHPEIQTYDVGICTEAFQHIELITPVEARFDRE